MTTDKLNFFFADDAILFSQNPHSLQSILTDVENYCNTLGHETKDRSNEMHDF